MTTTTNENEEDNGEQNCKPNEFNSTSPPLSSSVPEEIMDIMEYLSLNNKIIFKSQQRDEPELKQIEKMKVALDVYQRNPQTFLIRFGNYMEEKHLQDFARLSVAESDEEMHLMVNDYKTKLKNRQQDVKNRRYAALQKLIKEGEYFSEQEMMKRQPELYQELVGQYLSAKEKQQRDSYDVKNTTFSEILMHNLQQKQLNEIMEKAKKDVENTNIQETSCSRSKAEIETLNNFETDDDDIPMNCRQQWGNFDNEKIACSSSKVQAKKSPAKKQTKPRQVINLITADERELLRQEFISRMHEQFLTGQDEDFDYATVDDNTQFDDLKLINQDKEDKYFEGSDDDDDDDDNKDNFEEEKSSVKQSGINHMEENEESEDELDIFMSHLNKHHSLQK